MVQRLNNTLMVDQSSSRTVIPYLGVPLIGPDLQAYLQLVGLGSNPFYVEGNRFYLNFNPNAADVAVVV